MSASEGEADIVYESIATGEIYKKTP